MNTRYRLDEKVAVVTGCASGVGESVAKLFSELGAKVLAVDVNGDGLATAMDRIDNVACLSIDVTANGAEEEIVNAALEHFDQIDIVINNAGRVIYAEIDELTDEIWDMHLNVNVTAAMRICRSAASELRKRPFGRIVNIGSAVTMRSSPGLAAYTASKNALEGLTRVLSQELLPDITVNCIHPGNILSGMTIPLMEKDPSLKERYENFSPMGRQALPEDISHAALFLCLEASSYINGIGLNVDGGYVASG
jgi:NAD(P)-dependent dehydrogenase (short-subunit alcohol dehydrogenase family)|tara:strand:+ start:3689 stop:4441 length:753 start_codon:yes stop_codon:yes gene_type:complete